MKSEHKRQTALATLEASAPRPGCGSSQTAVGEAWAAGSPDKRAIPADDVGWEEEPVMRSGGVYLLIA